MNCYRRLPLWGLKNARDLGGYPTASGVTKYGVFLRSEVPAELSWDDMVFLRNYGLTDVIDLRSAGETEKTPDVLAQQSWVKYTNLPLFDENAARGALPQGGRSREDFSWAHHYVNMLLSGKRWAASVMRALAEAKGCVLFHCTTGKDRTGIITALLLGLCGVSDEDIMADYCVSSLYLKHMYAKMHALTPDGSPNDFSDPFFSTAPENMQAMLEYLHGHYTSFESYLYAGGAEAELCSVLRKKLVCRG